jgi:hypothetical protein
MLHRIGVLLGYLGIALVAILLGLLISGGITGTH